MGIHLQLKSAGQICILHPFPSESNRLRIPIFVTLPYFLRLLLKVLPSGCVDSVSFCILKGNWLIEGITAGNANCIDPSLQCNRNTHGRRIVLIAQRNGRIIGFDFIFQQRIPRKIQCLHSILLWIQFSHNVILNRKLGKAFIFCNRSDKVLLQNTGHDLSCFIKL